MSQNHQIGMQCKTCKNTNYRSTRNKKAVDHKIDLKKFCSTCRKSTAHKEVKV